MKKQLEDLQSFTQSVLTGQPVNGRLHSQADVVRGLLTLVAVVIDEVEALKAASVETPDPEKN